MAATPASLTDVTACATQRIAAGGKHTNGSDLISRSVNELVDAGQRHSARIEVNRVNRRRLFALSFTTRSSGRGIQSSTSVEVL
jgi:hypothetical protein